MVHMSRQARQLPGRGFQIIVLSPALLLRKADDEPGGVCRLASEEDEQAELNKAGGLASSSSLVVWVLCRQDGDPCREHGVLLCLCSSLPGRPRRAAAGAISRPSWHGHRAGATGAGREHGRANSPALAGRSRSMMQTRIPQALQGDRYDHAVSQLMQCHFSFSTPQPPFTYCPW